MAFSPHAHISHSVTPPRFFEKVPYGTSKSENFGKSAQMALLALFTANFGGTSKPGNFAKSAKMALLALLALGTL